MHMVKCEVQELWACAVAGGLRNRLLKKKSNIKVVVSTQVRM